VGERNSISIGAGAARTEPSSSQKLQLPSRPTTRGFRVSGLQQSRVCANPLWPPTMSPNRGRTGKTPLRHDRRYFARDRNPDMALYPCELKGERGRLSVLVPETAQGDTTERFLGLSHYVSSAYLPSREINVAVSSGRSSARRSGTIKSLSDYPLFMKLSNQFYECLV
jgi:hypothetical protein